MAPPSLRRPSRATTDMKLAVSRGGRGAGQPLTKKAFRRDRRREAVRGVGRAHGEVRRRPQVHGIGRPSPTHAVAVQSGPAATSCAASPERTTARSPDSSRLHAECSSGANALTTMSPTRTTRRRPGWSASTSSSVSRPSTSNASRRVTSSGLVLIYRAASIHRGRPVVKCPGCRHG